VELTYLGTATLRLDVGGLRLLTDPAFDPPGSRYDFGPWYAPRRWFASEKTYATPGAILADLDAVLLSHDHHADNLDRAGRALLEKATRVITNPAAARRLGGVGAGVTGLAAGATTQLGGMTITATPARHGPRGTPKVNQVTGFLLEAPGEPRVWISGDTVLHPALERWLGGLGKPVDVAIIHCGGVAFPDALGLGGALFTFDAAQAIAACRRLDPRLIVPVHRSGWTHFRQPEAELRAAFAAAGLGDRTRFLDLGETLRVGQSAEVRQAR
jgi:L-ascorbate metabolism protein UlaG (beta-lactamase superfamily)